MKRTPHSLPAFSRLSIAQPLYARPPLDNDESEASLLKILTSQRTRVRVDIRLDYPYPISPISASHYGSTSTKFLFSSYPDSHICILQPTLGSFLDFPNMQLVAASVSFSSMQIKGPVVLWTLNSRAQRYAKIFDVERRAVRQRIR